MMQVFTPLRSYNDRLLVTVTPRWMRDITTRYSLDSVLYVTSRNVSTDHPL